MDENKMKNIVSMMSMLHEGKTTKEIRDMLDVIAKCSFLAILRNESIPAGDVDFTGSMESVAAILSDSVQFVLMDYIESLKRPNIGTVNAD